MEYLIIGFSVIALIVGLMIIIRGGFLAQKAGHQKRDRVIDLASDVEKQTDEKIKKAIDHTMEEAREEARQYTSDTELKTDAKIKKAVDDERRRWHPND